MLKTFGIIAIFMFFVVGCAAIRYDRTWQNTGYPWSVPQAIRIVIDNVDKIDKACRTAGVITQPGYIVQGCYDSKTQTLYSIYDLEIFFEEIGHVWVGYEHIHLWNSR